jgi:hypothetical protein
MTTRIYQGTNQARGDSRRLQCRLVGLRCATPDPVEASSGKQKLTGCRCTELAQEPAIQIAVPANQGHANDAWESSLEGGTSSSCGLSRIASLPRGESTAAP